MLPFLVCVCVCVCVLKIEYRVWVSPSESVYESESKSIHIIQYEIDTVSKHIPTQTDFVYSCVVDRTPLIWFVMTSVWSWCSYIERTVLSFDDCVVSCRVVDPKISNTHTHTPTTLCFCLCAVSTFNDRTIWFDCHSVSCKTGEKKSYFKSKYGSGKGFIYFLRLERKRIALLFRCLAGTNTVASHTTVTITITTIPIPIPHYISKQYHKYWVPTVQCPQRFGSRIIWSEKKESFPSTHPSNGGRKSLLSSLNEQGDRFRLSTTRTVQILLRSQSSSTKECCCSIKQTTLIETSLSCGVGRCAIILSTMWTTSSISNKAVYDPLCCVRTSALWILCGDHFSILLLPLVTKNYIPLQWDML